MDTDTQIFELTEKEVGKLSRQIDIKNTKLEQLQNDEKNIAIINLVSLLRLDLKAFYLTIHL